MVVGFNFNKFNVQNDICVATDHIAFKVCLMRKSLGDMLYFCLFSAFLIYHSWGKRDKKENLSCTPEKQSWYGPLFHVVPPILFVTFVHVFQKHFPPTVAVSSNKKKHVKYIQ